MYMQDTYITGSNQYLKSARLVQRTFLGGHMQNVHAGCNEVLYTYCTAISKGALLTQHGAAIAARVHVQQMQACMRTFLTTLQAPRPKSQTICRSSCADCSGSQQSHTSSVNSVAAASYRARHNDSYDRLSIMGT